MTLKLINGNFNSLEVLEMISHMVNIKIRFHENKINSSLSEDDIKMRERKIKALQDEFKSLKGIIQAKNEIDVEALINFK